MAVHIKDIDQTQADFQTGTLTDVEADAGGYLRLADFIDDFDILDGSLWDTSGLASASVSDSKLVTEGTTYSYSDLTNSSAQYLGDLPSLDFYIETYLDYVGRTSDLGKLFLHLTTTTSQFSVGISDAWASANPQFIADICGNAQATAKDSEPDSGSDKLAIKRVGDTVEIYRNDTLFHSAICTESITGIYLTNTRFENYNGKTAKWRYLSIKELSGNRLSPQLDLSAVGMVESSSVSWTQTLNGGTITIETRISTDNGATWSAWKPCTNGGAIPDLPYGTDASTALLECRQSLSTTDPTATPQLESLTLEINSQKVHAANLNMDIDFDLPTIQAQKEQAIEMAAQALASPVGIRASKNLSMDISTEIQNIFAIREPLSLPLECSTVDLQELIQGSVDCNMDISAGNKQISILRAISTALDVSTEYVLSGPWWRMAQEAKSWERQNQGGNSWTKVSTPSNTWSRENGLE
jgi:hypothetical protein